MPRFILVVLLLAVAVYFLVRFIDGRRGGRPVRRPSGPRQPNPTRRTIAPDDDDQFLRDLERKRRRKKDEPPAG